MKKKITLAVICAVLSCVCLIGTTFAWLTDKTATVTNTFTVGNIKISLDETKGTEVVGGRQFKMIPGATIAKDPKVTVVGGSEACWLFVKIEETSNTFTSGGATVKYVNYEIADGWTALDGFSGVYYRQVNANSSTGTVDAVTYSVLANDQIIINSAATAADLAGATNTKLAFTAYAAQQAGLTVEQAWALFTA